MVARSSAFAPTRPTARLQHLSQLPSLTEDAQEEAQQALTQVGWSMPQEGDLTADDPFVQAIDCSIQEDVGVPLDALLNPAKVVNLERDLYNLRLQLAKMTNKDIENDRDIASWLSLSTAECDGGGGGEDADAIRAKISKKETDLVIERRAVFRGWLKNVFLAQAVLSLVLSFVMATQPEALFGQYSWFMNPKYNMDISIKVLGYWWWWLFIVPSLRSRRPKGNEKRALDIAFLGTPLISLLAPVATKDTSLIWGANLVVVAAAYAFCFLVDNDESGDDANTPGWLLFVYKSLDFGSGRERGARK